jgi:hypothetical protein
MIRRTPQFDEGTFAAAWRAFACIDRLIEVPDDLELRIRLTAESRAARRARPEWRRSLFGLFGLGVAAASVVTIVVTFIVSGDLVPGGPRRSTDNQVVQSTEDADDGVSIALVTFAADPLDETEMMQLVRLRMPRAALASLRIPVEDPSAPGLVDVDVLIGEDGLARDIRRIAFVRESGALP